MSKKVHTISTIGRSIERLERHQETSDKHIGHLRADVATLVETVDKLATITKEGFDRIDERFFDTQETLGRMQSDLDRGAYRFELQALEHRVEALEQQSNQNTA